MIQTGGHPQFYWYNIFNGDTVIRITNDPKTDTQIYKKCLSKGDIYFGLLFTGGNDSLFQTGGDPHNPHYPNNNQ
jgi:predicted ribosome quality control (RQC) complex YloA/Tae2 family protein